MWVVIIGIAWEIFEVFVEGTEETYGTKEEMGMQYRCGFIRGDSSSMVDGTLKAYRHYREYTREVKLRI